MDRLHGRKRLLVAPPAASALLHPFPFLHPSHAQCQASPAALGPAALAAAGAFEIELRPGELLYLPPLWFHEVESLSDANPNPTPRPNPNPNPNPNCGSTRWRLCPTPSPSMAGATPPKATLLAQLLLTSRYLLPTCCLLLCY